MKLIDLFCVQIVFLIVCSGLRNGIGVVSKNKQIKAEKETTFSTEHDVRQVTISGKQRRENLATRKRQPDLYESVTKSRPAIKIKDESSPSSEKRRSKAIEKKNNDTQAFHSKKSRCPIKCLPSKCIKFNDTNCGGLIIKDSCGCCSICKISAANGTFQISQSTSLSPLDSHLSENACNKLICPEFTECILNIQGIPVCRCPNMYACQSAPKDRICSKEGRTYKNRCFLKIEECVRKQKIEVAYSGDCKVVDDLSLTDEGENDKSLKKTNQEIKRSNKSKKNRTGKAESRLKRQNQRTQNKTHEKVEETLHLERDKQWKKAKNKRKKRF